MSDNALCIRGFLPEMITSQIMSAFYYISGTKASEVIGVNDTCLQKQQQQLNTLFFFLYHSLHCLCMISKQLM